MTKTLKTILGLVLTWALIAQTGVAIAQTPTVTTLQSAATATGNGTSLILSGPAGNPANTLGAAGLQITGTFTATITFETSTDGTNWVAVMATNLTDDVRATTATAAGEYTVLMGSAVRLRARISAYTSGTITVVGRFVPGLVARVAAGGGGGGSSGITVGTTTITSGTSGRLPYNNAGVYGEISTLTSDGTIVTFSPTVTTGTGATSGLNATANSLTTGTAFHFSSSSVTSGSIVNIASTSTAGATGVEGLNIAMSGANGTTAQTITGATISVTNTNATSGTNIGLSVAASGATTTNRAIEATAGGIFATSSTGTLLIGIAVSGQPTVGIGRNGSLGGLDFYGNTTARINLTDTSLALASVLNVGWCSGVVCVAPDLVLRRLAAASLVQGAANNATPVANLYTIGESSRGGTDSNVAGANGTVQSGLGTGTGALSTLILRSPIAAASGTTAQTYATGLTIIGGTAKKTSYTVATLPAAATVGAGATAFVTDALTPVFGSAVTGGGAVGVPVYSDGSTWLVG